MMNQPKKIILDCDPGHDDAIALLLAHGNPNIELLAVTTVVGNQTLEKVTRNALSVARIANITNVPFAAGAVRPLIRNVEVAPDIHGDSGLDGPVLPEPAIQLDKRHAIDLIIDTIMSHPPKTVTLVPTGGLTNIAMAVRKEPKIVERVKEVVLMGGGYHVGNWSAVAEFNIKIDPEAAHIVFNEKWPVTMVGLDLTYPPVHDPCAVAYVINPELIKTKRVPVDIELTGTLTLGMTVADFRFPPDDSCHTQVATELDHTGFWDLIVDSLERIGEVNL